MSWRKTDIEHLRMEFIWIARETETSKAETCRKFGISRKTGYKWLRRYQAEGLPGLAVRTCRPLTSPLGASGAVVTAICRLRNKHPSWGPKKLRVLLTREGFRPTEIPSLVTIGRILARSGLSVAKRRGRPRQWPQTTPLNAAPGPNDVWTVDFKGWWRTGDGKRCEPLTVRDLYSRYILCLRPMRRSGSKDVRKVFEELFERYGLPKVIRSDNGGPFASLTAPYGLTRLSAWWLTLGIKPDRIEPGHPEQNGGHERMHRDIANEIARQPAATWDEEKVRLEQWRVEYDLQRPHEALGMKTPGEVYHCSARRLHPVVPYAYPVTFGRYRVRENGCIRVGGKDVYLSQALTGLEVGVERLSTTGWRIWFCDLNVRESDPKPETQQLPDLPMRSETVEKCNLCPDNKVLPMSCS
jgi:transposase InsO family protein